MKTLQTPISPELQADYGLTDVVIEIKLNELKKNKETFFKISPESKAVYTVLEYDRATKSFCCENYENGNERYFKSTKTIYIGFTY